MAKPSKHQQKIVGVLFQQNFVGPLAGVQTFILIIERSAEYIGTYTIACHPFGSGKQGKKDRTKGPERRERSHRVKLHSIDTVLDFLRKLGMKTNVIVRPTKINKDLC